MKTQLWSLTRIVVSANLSAAVVALLPWLAIDALYVHRGQTDYWLKGMGLEAAILIFSIVVFSVANWIAFKRTRVAGKWVWMSVLVAAVTWGVWFIASLFFVYWFHLAIGGSE